MKGVAPALREVVIPGRKPDYTGKVRDIYDLGDRLLIVATDRVSAYDVILNEGIPGKGRVLTQISDFWFQKLRHIVPSHFLSTDVGRFPEPFASHRDLLEGRAMLVLRAKRYDVECVVRGYLAGSGWKEYQSGGAVCGVPLPGGLKLSSKLPDPIFTPATKAEEGHDENIDFDRMATIVGPAVAGRLRDVSLRIFREAAEHAEQRGQHDAAELLRRRLLREVQTDRRRFLLLFAGRMEVRRQNQVGAFRHEIGEAIGQRARLRADRPAAEIVGGA